MAPLELVHTDLCGPFRTAGVDGSLYFISVIDDSTRIIWGRLVQAKSEVFASFRAYKAWAETQHPGHRLQRVRMDGGGEYSSGAFLRWLDQQGIVVERTASYTPAQNGVAERENRTLLEAMGAMMFAANLPPQYWPEALRTAIHIRNRSPTRALFNVTPYELWWRKKPNIGHLRAYGCLAYAHIPKQHQQGKLALRWKATVDGARQRQGLDPALLHNQLVEKVTVERLVHGREHERYRRMPNIPPWQRYNG